MAFSRRKVLIPCAGALVVAAASAMHPPEPSRGTLERVEEKWEPVFRPRPAPTQSLQPDERGSRARFGGSPRCASLDASPQHQDSDDHQDQAEAARPEIAPTARVAPGGQRADQQEDEHSDEDPTRAHAI